MRPRDTRLLALLAGNFMVAMNFHIVGGLLDRIAAAFGISIARAGTLISSFAVVTVLAAPAAASLLARLERRRLLVGTLLLCVLANAAACLVHGFGQLLAVRLLAALTSAVFTPQAAATAVLLVPAERRAPAMALLMTGWSLAAVAGLPLGVLLGNAFGWRSAFAANGIGALVAAIALWRALPGGLHAPGLALAHWRAVLRPPLLALIAATALMSAANQTVFSYIAPLVRQVLGLQHAALAALLAVHGLASLCANVFAMRWLRSGSADRLAGLWIGCAIAGIACWSGGLWWPLAVFAAQFVWSLGLAGFPATQQARLAVASPALATASIALNSSAGYLGQAIGASYGGLVWSGPGPHWLFAAAMLPAAAGAWLSWSASRQQAIQTPT